MNGEKSLRELQSCIEQIRNFGTHVLDWQLTALGPEVPADAHLVSSMLLRHMLSLFDAIGHQIGGSVIDPAKVTLRALFEAWLNLEYLLQDSERRGMCYLTVHWHDQIRSHQKFSLNTPQGKQFRASLAKDTYLDPEALLEVESTGVAEEEIERCLRILSRDDYLSYEREYQRQKQKMTRNFPWYAMFDGPRNVGELAEKLDHAGMYETFYRRWSDPIHGTNLFDGILQKGPVDNTASLRPLRSYKDSFELFNCAASCMLPTYRWIINRYTPQKLPEFQYWYVVEIQKAFLRGDPFEAA